MNCMLEGSSLISDVVVVAAGVIVADVAGLSKCRSVVIVAVAVAGGGIKSKVGTQYGESFCSWLLLLFFSRFFIEVSAIVVVVD